jgi:acyl-CoA reductase-like NAD-dependent aldehyde dehydrogenase
MKEGLAIHLLINNEEVKADTYREVRDPGRLSDVVGTAAVGSAAHVDQAVRAAHQAFQSWKKVDFAERSALLLKAADLLEAEVSNLAPILTREAGILISGSRGEVVGAAGLLRATVEWAKNFYQSKQVEDDTGWVSVEKRPMGVIAAITPWNVPLLLCIGKLAPVLLTGNTIVIKPSPYAPLAVTIAIRKIAELFPPGVINLVHGDAEVGTALTTHPLVRKITFTGGGRTAKHVMKAAAESLKKVHLELGGNDPAIVLDDANLEEVIPQIAEGAFRRSGQICYAIKRVYVPEQMYRTACDIICDYVSKYKIGYGLDENATLGPVNNEMQYRFIKQLVDSTKQSKAKVLELGTKLEPDHWENGYYLQPTIVIDPDPEQEVVTCEQFGPVLPLIPYRTEEEAIYYANHTDLGLGSSVWSSDEERAKRVAREIEAGMTYINGAGSSPLGIKHVPFGGVKQSGIGRERTELGLEEFIEYHALDVTKKLSHRK